MNDKHLLEMAAKAVGRKLHYMTEIVSGVESEPFIAGWNPLTDDDDAFRLMVALFMDVNSYPNTGEVGACQHKHYGTTKGSGHRYFERPLKDDWNDATRRAIVRCAAEIGESTK